MFKTSRQEYLFLTRKIHAVRITLLKVCFSLVNFYGNYFQVIDFFLVEASGHTPQALIVLCEEELVAIELSSDNWGQLSPPYLVSLHAAAVTFSQHVSNVPQWLWDDIVSAGKVQMEKVSFIIVFLINYLNIFLKKNHYIYILCFFWAL